MLISETVCRAIILCSLNVYCASTRYVVQGAGDSAVTKTHSVSVLMKPSTPTPVAPLEVEPAGPLEQPLPKLCAPFLLWGMPEDTSEDSSLWAGPFIHWVRKRSPVTGGTASCG